MSVKLFAPAFQPIGSEIFLPATLQKSARAGWKKCLRRRLSKRQLHALKDGRAFFAESYCRFMGIFRHKTTHDGLDLVLESPLQFGLEWAIEQAFTLKEGEGRTTEQGLAQSLHFLL